MTKYEEMKRRRRDIAQQIATIIVWQTNFKTGMQTLLYSDRGEHQLTGDFITTNESDTCDRQFVPRLTVDNTQHQAYGWLRPGLQEDPEIFAAINTLLSAKKEVLQAEYDGLTTKLDAVEELLKNSA